MVTSNILQRTFKIKSTQVGTCFTIDVDNRQYIVTAQHIVEGLVGQSIVNIRHEEEWKELQVTLVGHGKGEVDISVLAAEHWKGGTAPLPLISAESEMILGQDVYFLGFPYELEGNVGTLNSNFPLPLVKKGIVSMFEFDAGYMLLDGHNNPGFSGAPVVFRPNNRGNDFCVAGVVAGYRSVYEPVYKDPVKKPKQDPLGYYRSNTGIILAYNISHALVLIRQTPIGVKLKTANSTN